MVLRKKVENVSLGAVEIENGKGLGMGSLRYFEEESRWGGGSHIFM